MKKFLLLLVLFFSVSSVTYATHMMGADVTYTCDSPYVYTFKLAFYRDCRGVSLSNPSSQTRIVCSGISRGVSLNLVEIKEITPYCLSSSARCSPTNTYATGEGIERHIYETTIDFTKAPYSNFLNCSGEIKFITEQCCRNGAINTGAANQNFYTLATFNLNKAPYNNSPQLDLAPIALLSCMSPVYLSTGGYDYLDFDSLSFKMAPPLSYNGNSISYSGYRYSYEHPFQVYYPGSLGPPYTNIRATPPIGFYLNPKSGEMIFTPTRCDEVTVAVVEVEEWRKDSAGNYEKIGSVRRDMEFITETYPENYAPNIEGPIEFTIDVTPCGGVSCFEFESFDETFVSSTAPRPRGDTVRFIDPVLPEGFSFEVINPNDTHPTARLCFDPNDYKIYTDEILITLQVKDNACPLNAITSRTIRFSLNVPDSLGKVKGYILNDTNQNCAFDAEDSLKFQRAIAIDGGINSYNLTNDDGSFDFCLEKGSRNFRLKPSPWFVDVCDSQDLEVLYDSTHEFVLYSTLKQGIIGNVVETVDSGCSVSQTSRMKNGQLMKAIPGDYYAITDLNGFYLLDVPAGTYKVFPVLDTAKAELLCVDTAEVTVSSGAERADTFYINKDKIVELEIHVSTNTGSAVRRADSNNIIVNAQNNGEFDVDSVSIFLNVPDDLEVDLNSVKTLGQWTDYGNGKLKVLIENLSPGAKTIKTLKATYPASGFSNGDRVDLIAHLNPTWSLQDIDNENDTSDFTITIVAAYDPNQKNCSQDSVFTVTDRELVYTVHFQNTGDTFARDVIVTDELAEALDISSLNVFAASHDYSYSLVGRTLWVNFENINLPDSSEDYDASQGFFTFSINLKPEIFKDSIIENSASIFFDFEDPIITNTQVNHFKTPIEPEYPEDLYWCLNEEVTIPFKLNFNPTASTKVYLEISDEDGLFKNPIRIDSVSAAKALDTLSFIFLNQFDFDGTEYRARLVSEYPRTESFESYTSGNISFIKNLNANLELTDSVCFGQQISALGDVKAERTYLYQNDQLTDSINAASIIVDEYHHEDKVYLIQTLGECEFITDTKTLEAFAQPTVELDLDSIFCYLGEEIDLIKQTSISEGSGQISSIQWFYGDGDSLSLSPSDKDPSHYYTSGYFDLKVLVQTDNNCSDIDDQTLRLIAPPVAEIAPFADSVCNTNEGLVFENQSSDGDEPITGALWSTDNATYTDLDSIKHTYSNVGTFDIGLKVSDAFGCTDSTVNQVTITSFPNTTISINDEEQCLNDHSFELSATENSSYSKLKWDVQGTSFKSNQITLHFTNAGTFPYSLAIENSIGCVNIYNGTLEVYPIEEASFSLEEDYCTDETALLSFDPVLSGTIYKWYEDGVLIGDGDQNLSLDLPRTATISLKTITENQCADSFSQLLTVNQSPSANISTENVCLGDTVTIKNQSEDFDLSTTEFEISFGDGSSDYIGSYRSENPHFYSNPGNYQISLLAVTPYCRDSINTNVNVFQVPTLLFEDTTGTNGFSRLFVNNSVNANNYFWYFNEQNAWILNNQPSFEFEFDEKGEYLVSLVGVTTDDCTDTLSKMVSVTGEVTFNVPSIYSPNGDGIGDVYLIEPSSDIETIQFDLYNAQGQKVTSSTDPNRLITDPISAGIYVVRVAITDIYGDSYSYYETILVVK